MQIWDQHVHSEFSEDAFCSMTDMALAEAEAGMSGVCFTDHCELEHYDTGLENPDCWRPDRLFLGFAEAKKAVGDRIALRLGAELGGGNHLPERAEEIGRSGLDFIIGSVHNLRGMPDFFMGTAGLPMYSSEEACYELLSKYIEEYMEVARLGAVDVLGHIGYPLRYMKKMGVDISLQPLREPLAALLKTAIENGKGIELNTSGYRRGLGEPMPAPFLLKVYRELGGEIITVGSDAHSPEEAGADVRKGLILLKELGYKYYCAFSNRKPEFIRLEL